MDKDCSIDALKLKCAVTSYMLGIGAVPLKPSEHTPDHQLLKSSGQILNSLTQPMCLPGLCPMTTGTSTVSTSVRAALRDPDVQWSFQATTSEHRPYCTLTPICKLGYRTCHGNYSPALLSCTDVLVVSHCATPCLFRNLSAMYRNPTGECYARWRAQTKFP